MNFKVPVKEERKSEKFVTKEKREIKERFSNESEKRKDCIASIKKNGCSNDGIDRVESNKNGVKSRELIRLNKRT